MKEIYTVYADHNDMTFIMEEYIDKYGRTVIKCIGWYFGEPDADITEECKGKLKAVI